MIEEILIYYFLNVYEMLILLIYLFLLELINHLNCVCFRSFLQKCETCHAFFFK